MPEKKTKIMLGLSGGVDSSVAALLLLQQGFKVEAVFMKNWDEDDGTEHCTAQQDFADAQAVADKLGIRLHYVNFAAEYWDQVFRIFLQEYQAGRTPNPDILCNKEIKFKAFLHYALSSGADAIATGHYARLVRDASGQNLLYKAKDPAKDQSYFLYAVHREALNRSYFPLGELHKTEVRKIAQQHGLITAGKKDSTGICFIGERRFRQFLQQYLPTQPGNIEDEYGKVFGKHQGLIYYTLGQRKGLGLGGIPGKKERPWFVAKKDMQRNVLVVVQEEEHPLLMSDRLTCSQCHWLTDTQPSAKHAHYLSVKTRYRQPDQMAKLQTTVSEQTVVSKQPTIPNDHAHTLSQTHRLSRDSCSLKFDKPQWAVTPGQSAVFYQGELCIGGGIIDHADTAITKCTHG